MWRALNVSTDLNHTGWKLGLKLFSQYAIFFYKRQLHINLQLNDGVNEAVACDKLTDWCRKANVTMKPRRLFSN